MNETTPVNDNAVEQTNPLGVVGLIMSCFGLVICIFSVPGLILSIIAMRRQPKNAATAGVVVGSIATAFNFLLIPLLIGLLLPALGRARLNAVQMQDRQYLTSMHRDMSSMKEDGTKRPEWDPEKVKASLGTDPWGKAYRVQGDGSSVPKINGAGPDGLHDTEDDTHPITSSKKDG